MGCGGVNVNENQKANDITNLFMDVYKNNIFYNNLELILDFGQNASSISSDEQMYSYLTKQTIDPGLQKLIVYFLHQAGGKLKTISNNDKLPMIIIQTFLLFMANSDDPKIQVEKTKIVIYLITSSKNNDDANMVNMAKFVANVENFVEFIMKITKSFLLLISLLPTGFDDLTNLFNRNNKLGFTIENSESFINRIIHEINPKYNYKQLLKYSMKYIFFPLNNCM